jgi:hypothetical protein
MIDKSNWNIIIDKDYWEFTLKFNWNIIIDNLIRILLINQIGILSQLDLTAATVSLEIIYIY